MFVKKLGLTNILGNPHNLPALNVGKGLAPSGGNICQIRTFSGESVTFPVFALDFCDLLVPAAGRSKPLPYGESRYIVRIFPQYTISVIGTGAFLPIRLLSNMYRQIQIF